MTMDRLFRLARGEDVEAFRAALLLAKQQGLDVNQRGEDKRTLLYAAAGRGCRANVVELLRGRGKEAGFHEVNTVDRTEWTALHWACFNGHTRVVEELLEGAGREAGFVAIATRNQTGHTALHLAFNEDTVGMLLTAATRIGAEERHALVHALTNHDRTVMHEAGSGAAAGLLKFCSEAELDFLLQTKNNKGQNPLHGAAYWRDPQTSRSLLREVRERGWRGEREEEEWRNSLDSAGLTALHLAIAFPEEAVEEDEDNAEAVRALLCPFEAEGEAEQRARGHKRKKHPDEQEAQGREQQDDEEEERRRKEGMCVGGLDPNKKCGKRTVPCRLLEAAERRDDEEEDDDEGDWEEEGDEE
jgi:ankyrin repeat protein